MNSLTVANSQHSQRSGVMLWRTGPAFLTKPTLVLSYTEGGQWKHTIGVAWWILDSMLLQVGPLKLTHEVPITFMAEVSAIVNDGLLIPVSTDSQAPPLSRPHSDPFPALFSKEPVEEREPAWAETLWTGCWQEYLSTPQSQQKWQWLKPGL